LVAKWRERDFLNAHRGGALNWKAEIWEDVNVLITPVAIKKLECVVSVDR